MTTKNEYLATDQEVNHNEQPIPAEYTHVITIWFNHEEQKHYVLPTEDVFAVYNNLSRAGPILDVTPDPFGRPQQEIKVIVVGSAGTGKTAICRVLEDALTKNGIKVTFVDPDTDVVRSWADTQNSIDYIRDHLSITIDEQQAGRNKL